MGNKPSRRNPPANAPRPAEAKPAHSGHGASSALARLKQWERSRAALRGTGRDKPGEG